MEVQGQPLPALRQESPGESQVITCLPRCFLEINVLTEDDAILQMQKLRLREIK